MKPATMRIHVTVPTAPDYYSASTNVSAEDAQALAESIAQQMREDLPREYPDAKITVELVPERTSYANRWHIEAGTSDDDQNLRHHIEQMYQAAWDQAEREVW